MPALGLLSTDRTGTLVQRLLRSMSASDPDANPVVYHSGASERADGSSVLSVLPPWVSSRARLLMDSEQLKSLARPFVLRDMLRRPGGALLLDERLVAVQSILAGFGVPEDRVVLVSSGADTRKDMQSPVSRLAIGWGSQQSDLLDDWCDSEVAEFRDVLQGSPPARTTWLERNLHLPHVDLLPAALIYSPRGDAVEAGSRLRSARLVDLPPGVVDEPWLLGSDLPTNVEFLTSLREFVGRHADVLRGVQEVISSGDLGAGECQAGLRDQYRLETGLWLSGRVEEPPVAEDFSDPSLAEWLAGPPAESASPCSRYALWPWHRRPDLRAAFPDPVAEDSRAYLAWCRSRGVLELGLDPELLGSARRQPGHPRPQAVNLAAYAGAVLGVGESGRRVSMACRAAGYEVINYPVRETANRQVLRLAGEQPRCDHDRGDQPRPTSRVVGVGRSRAPVEHPPHRRLGLGGQRGAPGAGRGGGPAGRSMGNLDIYCRLSEAPHRKCPVDLPPPGLSGHLAVRHVAVRRGRLLPRGARLPQRFGEEEPVGSDRGLRDGLFRRVGSHAGHQDHQREGRPGGGGQAALVCLVTSGRGRRRHLPG